MATTFVRLEGFDEARKTLDGLTYAIQRKILAKALRAGAKVVQTAAVASAPVRSGQLKRSIKVRAAPNKRRIKGRVGIVVSATPSGNYKGKSFYASFLEYGTKRMAKRPYLAPAAKRVEAAATAAVIDTLKSEIALHVTGAA